MKDKHIISHELLTAVLGCKAWQITGNNIDWTLNYRDDDIIYEKSNENQYCIDADKLGRLCKEWAYTNGYILHSGFHKNHIGMHCCDCTGWVSSTIDNGTYTFEKTELEAIINACEWILINS